MPEAADLRARLIDLRAKLRAIGADVDETLPIHRLRSDRLRAVVAAEAERIRVLTSTEGCIWRSRGRV